MSRLAGDAYPLLTRQIYEAIGFQPMFDWLPAKDEYDRLKLGRLIAD